ncbi:toxin-antitoxin system HicB family antitoxin [Peterkaempfera bronchialis]|uniref:toxin-antitoxin system HicB family antitoxin n=1 Tax=Peterkaempfera bronchialis TaxID=2126346 RepID=UPI0026B43B31|nr:toxin-antitoxin system HicB family antitoxin [Peterkaempfera bronchialis]
MAERKKFLLRIDPQVHDALQRWADDELRSLNAHIEYLLRRALEQAGRPVRDAPPPRRGRPPRAPEGEGTAEPAGE